MRHWLGMAAAALTALPAQAQAQAQERAPSPAIYIHAGRLLDRPGTQPRGPSTIVDTIDHGSFLDDKAVSLMKRRGTWLVPTMLAPATAAEQAASGALPPAVVGKAREAAAAAKASHRKAIAAGVKIAFGTDTGVSKHGDNAKEFARWWKPG
ncbi:hypothetical protein [Qipengyuania sediminis]|uniref:hypothetical protein n=1 Tax=Qipengyuania sediminis TaxID=1532023 RepID=UPI001F10D9B1|nr:hypothetical protein [Qipengyuania sediminis]